MRETWVRPLGWEDPLEEGMAIPSCILAWRIPWTEEPGGSQSMGSKRVGHYGATKHSTAKNACFLNRDHRCTDIEGRCNTGQDFNHLASESLILLKAD